MMKSKASLSEFLLKNKYKVPLGKGDLAPVKFNSLEMKSDEDKADKEQKVIDEERLLAAIQMLEDMDSKKKPKEDEEEDDGMDLKAIMEMLKP